MWVTQKAWEGLHVYSCLLFSLYMSIKEHVTPRPTSIPCLIIISSCLCLPRSLMMTGMARLPESQVPTLMSPCLTLLLSAQVSPHPCPLIYNVPGGGGGKRDRAGSKGEGGFIVLFLSPLSLFIYDISSMTRDMARPQGERAACNTLVMVTPKAEQAECCGFLADRKTIAPLPVTLRESAALKFGWMRAITGLHARLDHEEWIMVIFGSAGGSGRFNALSVTMSVADVIWHCPSGKCHMFCIVVHCCWWKTVTQTG